MSMAPLPPPTPEQRRAALIAELPDDELRACESYYQQQLAAALATANAAAAGTALGAADPEEVERQLIEDLIREAEGRDHPEGVGAVPIGNNLISEIVPPETDPRLLPTRGRSGGGGGSGEMSRGRIIGLAVGGVVALVAFGWSIVGGPATAEEATLPTPTITTTAVVPTAIATTTSDSEIEVSFPTSLEIGRPDGSRTIYRVTPSTGQLGAAWEPVVTAESAAWLQGTFVNTVICLDPSAAPLVDTLERGTEVLMRPASGVLRRYEVVRIRRIGRQQTEALDQRRAGMTLIVCGTSGNERTVVETVYRPDLAARAPETGGTLPVALADLASVRLEAVRVLTPTQELPPGLTEVQLDLAIANLTTDPLAWVDLADQLEIGGQIAEGRAAVALRDTIDAKAGQLATFRYLIPASGGSATWRLTAATGESVALQVALPAAPRPNAGTLTATLRPEQVQIVRSAQPPQLALTLELTASGADAVAVSPGEVSVWAGALALPLLDTSTLLPVFVAPGTPQPLTLVVAYPTDTTTVTVQVGSQRWRVQLPGRR